MKRYIAYAFVLSLLASCSQTSHLAEGEVLYKGIKEISYGKKAKAAIAMENKAEEEGVITAVANAVNTIDALLSGKADVTEKIADLKNKERKKYLTKAQRDSLHAELVLMNNALSTAQTEIDAALAYAPNGAIFGSSSWIWPFPVGLYTYNSFANAKTLVGKWIMNTFGEQPVYISTVNPATRALVAKNILRNNGFFNAQTEYHVLPQKDSLKAKLAYSIYPHQLYRLDSIEYRSFNPDIDSLITSVADKRLLQRGDAFNVINLDEERTRLSNMLRDNGYFNFQPEYVTYKADTIQREGWVQLRVLPASGLPSNVTKRYVLGNTRITLLKYNDYEIVDSIGSGIRRTAITKKAKPSSATPRRRNRQFGKTTMVYSGKTGREPLKLSEFRKYLHYDLGTPYSNTLMNKVRDNISQMGVFSQLQFNYRHRTSVDSTANDTLDLLITAMLDKPYDSEFAANIVSKSNGQIGPGLSYSIGKKNVFRRAETLKMKVYGSYEWQTGAQPASQRGGVMNSFELGGQLSLTYPRVIAPLSRRLKHRITGTTDFAVDLSWMNRGGYYSMAQLKADITYRFSSKPTVNHTLVPISIKYTSLLNRSEAFDSILAKSPALRVSMRNQFVPSMEYSFTVIKDKGKWPNSLTVTMKQAGNITSVLYTMCGRRFNDKDKRFLGVPFAQFVKFNVDFKQERRLTGRSSLMVRLAAGVVYSYGNSTTAPYSDLFSVGGANSIRAFCLRGVGPGCYNPSRNGYSYIDQVGDLKFEANLEYRFPIFGDLYGALFADAGNVWLLKKDLSRPGAEFSPKRFAKDLALGTGVGVRYDLSFLVIRFDIGVGIHAPYDTGKKGYYNMPKFWDSLGFHFAVGYPF